MPFYIASNILQSLVTSSGSQGDDDSIKWQCHIIILMNSFRDRLELSTFSLMILRLVRGGRGHKKCRQSHNFWTSYPHCIQGSNQLEIVHTLLTFTLLSFFGVLTMLLKLEAGKGLKLFLHSKWFFSWSRIARHELLVFLITMIYFLILISYVKSKIYGFIHFLIIFPILGVGVRKS